MPDLLIVQFGPLPFDLAGHLAARAPDPVSRLRPHLDPTFAYDPARDQYLAASLLDRLARFRSPSVLGITALDLFNPILTFVFGEAHLPGRAAVFSIHRLQEEFYGLPPNRDLLLARAVKEMLHELGHTRGLTHCPDASCVMSSSHSVEGVDRKLDVLCRRCAGRLPALQWPKRWRSTPAFPSATST